MSMILLLMGLLKSDVKEVNVKSVDLVPANSIVEKVEAKQEVKVELEDSTTKKSRVRRHTWTSS